MNKDSLKEEQEYIQDSVVECDTTLQFEELMTIQNQSENTDIALSINVKDTEILMNANCEIQNNMQLFKNNTEDVNSKRENSSHPIVDEGILPKKEVIVPYNSLKYMT